MPGSFRICLVEQFTNRLTSDQKDDLERNVTLNEIKSAVWDCGTNKSPGSDGFTFEFFIDIESFLIKTLSVYVPDSSLKIKPWFISDLISDVQSAFVTNRQILDGPFILNELLSWCKHKKMKSMFFKRGWISGCLKSAMGSVLVNGNPTIKFQFHKGLKQGDPLSLFLFILVMESLYLSFRRVIDAGLFSDDMALKHRYPRLYALELSKYISVSEKLSSDSLVFSFRRIPKGGIEEEQQRSLQARIEGIILAPMLDRWIWSYESSGEFSVKSARSFIDDSLLPKEDVPTRWVNVIPI
ncbi:RNA-directed DNA polymerase, eukaryota [Tanacetum coccineum]|uniref:RNA-directed DNA polymerase, eukaryota n=1 Tax=Tanacetum coccineum TaxID=301880 RepID=A0ABQ5H8U1_9ASTR